MLVGLVYSSDVLCLYVQQFTVFPGHYHGLPGRKGEREEGGGRREREEGGGRRERERERGKRQGGSRERWLCCGIRLEFLANILS